MLIEFRVKNYRSFRDEQVLSMVASKQKRDDELDKNVVHTEKYDLLKAAGIFGANASGKSNLIMALSTMRWIILNSTNLREKQGLPFDPFKLNRRYLTEPIAFEATLLISGVRYQYGFEFLKDKITSEWLLAYPKNRSQVWFERSYNFETDKEEWYFGPNLKGQNEAIKNKTRQSTTFISAATQWKHEQLSVIYNWFHVNLRQIPKERFIDNPTVEMIKLMGSDKEEENKAKELILDILKSADLGIRDLIVKEVHSNHIKLPEDIPDYLKNEVLKEDNYPMYRVNFLHNSEDSEIPIPIDFEQESDGTKRFFDVIGPWLESMMKGYTLLVDEIELSLHSSLSRKLLQLVFTLSEKSQIIFATHDTTLLDLNLLRRDQIWFVAKDKHGASELYSLADFKKGVRKNEAIQKGYLAGRYGAVPFLDNFEDVWEKAEKE